MKFISIFSILAALVVMLYASTGQMAEVSSSLSRVQEETAERLHTPQDMLTLTITVSELGNGQTFYTGKNEISYRGNRYDIISTERMGDEIILTVLSDKKEDGLISELKELIDGWGINQEKNNSKQPATKHINFLKDYISASKLTLTLFEESFDPFSVQHIVPCTNMLIAVLKSPPQEV